jgi:glyceraldehyde 3-phosphate dehydrogenase
MSTRVAINGFGRIGRLVFRNLMENPGSDLEVVAINDIAALDNLAYLLRHDSIQPRPSARIEVRDERLHWNNHAVEYLSVADPADLPWRDRGVEIVIEASGLFTRKEDAEKHLQAGAERVIITAPAKGDVVTICPGVNDDDYDPDKHRIISNASCTTNALAPVAKVLNDRFGIVQRALTTIHAYTISQSVVDAPSKKWRRGRAAALNIVPTSTGAAKATTLVLPGLKGKIDGIAMRVPVATGSIVDFVAVTEKLVTVEAVNAALREAAQSDGLNGILGASDEELVSSDIIGNPLSALVDLQSTMTFGDRMVKVLAWYDNEWGYAARVAEFAAFVAERSPAATRP